MTSFQVFPTIGHATAVAAADHGNLDALGRKSRSGNWYSVKELRHVQACVARYCILKYSTRRPGSVTRQLRAYKGDPHGEEMRRSRHDNGDDVWRTRAAVPVPQRAS